MPKTCIPYGYITTRGTICIKSNHYTDRQTADSIPDDAGGGAKIIKGRNKSKRKKAKAKEKKRKEKTKKISYLFIIESTKFQTETHTQTKATCNCNTTKDCLRKI